MLKINDNIWAIQYKVNNDSLFIKLCKAKVIGMLVRNKRYIYFIYIPTNKQELRASQSELAKHTTRNGINFRYKFYLDYKDAKESFEKFIKENKDELLISINGRIAELRETKKELVKGIVTVKTKIKDIIEIQKNLDYKLKKLIETEKMLSDNIDLINDASKKLKNEITKIEGKK